MRPWFSALEKLSAMPAPPVPMKVPPVMVPVPLKSMTDVSPDVGPSTIVVPPLMVTDPLASTPSPPAVMCVLPPLISILPSVPPSLKPPPPGKPPLPPAQSSSPKVPPCAAVVWAVSEALPVWAVSEVLLDCVVVVLPPAALSPSSLAVTSMSPPLISISRASMPS